MLQRFALVVDYACTTAFVLMTALLAVIALQNDDPWRFILMIVILFDWPFVLAFIGGKAFRFVVA